MGMSILYPSWQNRLSYSSNKPRKLFYILPYGPRLILWARAHHITKPIAWARPGPMGPGPKQPPGPWALAPAHVPRAPPPHPLHLPRRSAYCLLPIAYCLVPSAYCLSPSA